MESNIMMARFELWKRLVFEKCPGKVRGMCLVAGFPCCFLHCIQHSSLSFAGKSMEDLQKAAMEIDEKRKEAADAQKAAAKATKEAAAIKKTS